MEKLALLILSTLFFTTTPLFAAEQIMSANDVNIYPSGAEIFMDIPVEGDFSISLPGTFDKESIFYIKNESVPIENFSVTEETRTNWIPPSLSELNRKIESLKAKSTDLGAELAGLKQSKTYLNGLQPGSVKTDDFLVFLKDLQNERKSLETKISDIENQQEENATQISLLTGEFNEKMPKDRNKVIVIKGKALKAGKARIMGWTRYAGWNLMYGMDLRTQEKLIHSDIKAHVTQKSGVDWDGRLHFHTVQPKRGVSTPQATPLIVDFGNPTRKLDMVLSENMLMTSKAASGFQPIQISETQTDMVISAENRVSGTGTMSEINLGTRDMKGETDIVALPYLSDETWIVADVAELDGPIIPGKVQLLIDGEPSGKTSIREYARGEKFTMAFGRSPMIKTKREKIIPKKGSTWIGKGTLQEGYIITVTNGFETDMDVTVIDRLPLSIQENIKVSMIEAEPEPDDRSDKDILTWKVSLKGGETRTIKVLYGIKYPSDKEIVFH